MPSAQTLTSYDQIVHGLEFLALTDNDRGLMQNLDLLEEKREHAAIQLAAYQQRITCHFNKGVRPRNFQLGDWVLWRVFLHTKEPKEGKLSVNWEGPYRVVKINRLGMCWLQYLHGRPVLRSWNAEHLKKYYI